jgi:dipeptidyl aminopeptidase/acylaminoacyl peptidase
LRHEHPWPDGDGHPAVQVVTDRDKITQLSFSLTNTARREVMTLDNCLQETPIDETSAVPPLPRFQGTVRCRSIYQANCLEHPVAAKVIEMSVEAGEEARMLPEVPMKMKLIDDSAVMLPLTSTGMGGVVILRASLIITEFRRHFEMLWERATPLGAQQAPSGRPPLTDIQEQVLRLLCQGLSDEAIARRVNISAQTVRRHVSTLMRLLDAKTRFARWLVVAGVRSNTEVDCRVLDLTASGAALTPVTDGSAGGYFWPQCWADDSAGFYATTTHWGEFFAAAHIRLSDASIQPIATPDWDVEEIAARGETLLWTVNQSGTSLPQAARAGQELTLPQLPPSVITEMDLTPGASRVVFQLDAATRPAEIGVMDLDAGTFRYLTDTRPPALRTIRPVEPDTIHFTARDGRTVHALLYRPHGDGPFPAVMSIHGGPEMQERPEYLRSGLYQYLLAHGIAIFAPNVAGSRGYGLAYQTLIYRDWGGIDLRDFEDAVTHLTALDWIDPDRIAVMGGSYGGFATLSCLSRIPRPWAAGVSICGPSNLVTLARACPPTWRHFVNATLGDPDKDAEFLSSRSPVSYVENIKAPLLVIQGAQDPRVPQAEADQIVERLRARGVEVRYDLYGDEGHGFTNRDNEIQAYTDIAAFLTQHLHGGGTVPAPAPPPE